MTYFFNPVESLDDVNKALLEIEEAFVKSLQRTFTQDTAPLSGLHVGDTWIDTSNGNRLYTWNGKQWVDAQDADIAQALVDAADASAAAALAQATADGKVVTYYQAGEPTGGSVGDLWLDIDDGNKLYRHNGTSWIEVQDDGIAQAIADAQTAQNTADGKIVTFYATSAPTAEGIGDIWVDTDDDNHLYRWNGISWQSIRDLTIAAAQADATQAISDASAAQATADGKVVTFYQDAAPTAEGVGDLWIDTNDGNKLYRWSGTAWGEVQDAGIAQAIAAAAGAQSTADGKIVTFYQAAQPTAEGTGDIWFDTDDGNKQYRWSGSAWVSVRDSDIAQAITDAATAQATADGKVTTFYQTTSPVAEGIGDLWIDTDDGDKLYRWNGTTWVSVQDAEIQTAIANAATAQTTADSKIVTFYQTGAPGSADTGDLWVDTDDNNQLYRYNGTSWDTVRDATIAAAQADATQAIADAATAQATADGKIVSFYQTTMPAGSLGDLWIDTDDGNKLYRHNGTTFIEVQDDDITTAILDAADAQATADGKVTTFYQSSAPTAEGVGDLWHDTDDGIVYRWSGSAWQEVADQTSDIITSGLTITDGGLRSTGYNLSTRNGIFFGYNAGDPRLMVGDGLTKYLDFNADTGDLDIGPDVNLQGTSYIGQNAPIYFNTYFESLDGFAPTNNVTVTNTLGARMRLDTSNGVESMGLQRIQSDGSWSNNRRFYAEVRIGIGTAMDGGGTQYTTSFYIMQGAVASGRPAGGSTDNAIGFKLSPNYTSGNWEAKGFTCNGFNSSETSATVIGADTSVHDIELYCEFDTSGAGSIDFYLNGTSIGSLTTNLPSGSNQEKSFFEARYEAYSGGAFRIPTSTHDIHVGRFTFWQEN